MTEEFEFVSNLLKEPLSDEPEQLIRDLEAVEVWNSRMQFFLAECNSILNKELLNGLPDSGTELERKTAQKAFISDRQEERDKIEGLCEAIKTRITLGQSILRYFSVTQNPSMQMNKTSIKQILGDPNERP